MKFMENKWLILTNDEEVKIAWDPYRLRIMSIFRISDEPLTVKQVADKMGEVPAKVHYHVQKLLKIDMLELVKTKIIRGIVAKYYTNKYAGSDIASKGISDKVVIAYARNAHYNNLNQSVTKFLDSMLLTDQVMKTKDDIKFADSAVGFFKMYLSQDERDEFKQYILNTVKNHEEPGEGKKEYGLLAGLTRRS